MRIVFLIFRAPLILLLLAVCIAAVFELLRRDAERDGRWLETPPLEVVNQMLAADQWQEAEWLAGFVADHPHLGDATKARALQAQAQQKIDSLPDKAQAFLKGAITGEPDNTASFLGALTLDLFVLGDIRDLAVQGYKEVVYDDGDAVILALSAAGLTLTLLPELHWAPSALKGLKRTGSLSEPFAKSLGKGARRALKTGDFKSIGKVVDDFGTAGKHMGLGGVKGAMRAVQSEADLAKLAKAAGKNPRETYVLARLSGNAGVRQLGNGGENVAKLASKLRLASRAGKISKKALGALPSGLLVLLAGLSLIWAVRLLRLWR